MTPRSDHALRRIAALASHFVKKHPAEALRVLGTEPGLFGASRAQQESAEDMLADDIASVRRELNELPGRVAALEAEIAGDDDDGDEPGYDDGALGEDERLALASDLSPEDIAEMDDAERAKLAAKHRVPIGSERPQKKPACAACAAARMVEP